MSTLLSSASIDSQVHAYLPPWLLQASSQRLLALSRALQLSQQQKARVTRALAVIQPIDSFAQALLSQALLAHTGTALDPQSSHFFHTRHLSRSSTLLSLPRQGSTAIRSAHTLLQAALQNFSGDEAASNGFAGKAQLHLDRQIALAMTPESFAGLSRQTDLGGRYQTHLDQVLTAGFSADLRRSHYYDLEVAALTAVLGGSLDEYTFTALLRFIHADFNQPMDDPLIRCLQLRVEGKSLCGVVVFKVLPESAFAVSSGLVRFDKPTWVLYVPGDPQRPLLQFSSQDSLAQDLGRRLQSAGYERFFRRFVARADQLTFAARLAALRQQPAAMMALNLAVSTLDTPLFTTLASQQVAKIRADARLLAVPTDDEDENSRLQRLHAYETAGLVLLNVAALFVPLLGEVMLGVAAAQLASQVFEGLQDWQEGDTEQALEHLTDVVESLALFAGASAATQVVGKALRHASFIDELVPVVSATGEPRLWKADLADYRIDDGLVEGAAADSQGLFANDSRHYVRLQGDYYAVRHDATAAQWRIAHPTASERYGPWLASSGHGGWRHSGENPLQWQGRGFLLKRLLPSLASSSEQTLEQLLTITGLEEGQLRQLHLDNLPAPGLLRDCLLRMRLDQDISRFIEQLSEPAALGQSNLQMREYLQARLPGAATAQAAELATLLAKQARESRPALFDYCYGLRTRAQGTSQAVLQVDFPGLPSDIAADLVASASDVERERLTSQWRVPLSMASRVRQHLHEVRVSRSIEGLYLQSGPNPDIDVLTLALLKQLPGWPEDLAVELYQDSLAGRRLAASGTATASRRVRIVRTDGAYLLDDTQVLASVNDTMDLCSVLTALLSETEQATLGLQQQGLRSRLGERLHGKRDQVGQWLGLVAPRQAWFNPPQRLADGRIGYSLSGRGLFGGRRNAQVRDLRQVYPGLSDSDAVEFIEALQNTGVDATARIRAYQQELSLLDETLRGWSEPGQTSEQSLALQRSRQQAAQLIRRAWRKLSPRRWFNHTAIGYSLSLEGLRIGELPTLPAEINFDHVVDLHLHNMGLSDASAPFLQRFPRLRELNLANNQLTRLPDALSGMAALTRLMLQGNRIELSASSSAQMAGLGQLRALNLNDNPIGTLLDLQGLTRLEELLLRNTGLQQWPDSLLGRFHGYRLDLRNNQIRTVPEAVLEAPGWINRGLALHDNPLAEETLRRLEQYQQRTGVSLTSLRVHVSPVSKARNLWLKEAPTAEAGQAAITWQALSDEPGAVGLFQILADLSGTAEFRRVPQALGQRVWALLDAAYRNSALRTELFELATTPVTCGDSVTLNFAALETKALVLQAASLTGDEPLGARLLKVARRLFRQEQLDLLVSETATAQASAGATVDSVELNLAYRIALADELDLPSKPQSMLFPALAPLASDDFASARSRIEAIEQTPALQQFISSRDFWLDYLKEHFAARFEELDQPYRLQLDAIMSNQGVLRDDDYLNRMRSLGESRELAETALALRLTEQEWAALQGQARVT